MKLEYELIYDSEALNYRFNLLFSGFYTNTIGLPLVRLNYQRRRYQSVMKDYSMLMAKKLSKFIVNTNVCMYVNKRTERYINIRLALIIRIIYVK